MTCTNFPKDNLVPNVTQHQVGNVTYLYKGGAPTAPLWEAITGPLAAKAVTVEGGGSVQDFIDDYDVYKKIPASKERELIYPAATKLFSETLVAPKYPQAMAATDKYWFIAYDMGTATRPDLGPVRLKRIDRVTLAETETANLLNTHGQGIGVFSDDVVVTCGDVDGILMRYNFATVTQDTIPAVGIRPDYPFALHRGVAYQLQNTDPLIDTSDFEYIYWVDLDSQVSGKINLPRDRIKETIQGITVSNDYIYLTTGGSYVGDAGGNKNRTTLIALSKSGALISELTMLKTGFYRVYNGNPITAFEAQSVFYLNNHLYRMDFMQDMTGIRSVISEINVDGEKIDTINTVRLQHYTNLADVGLTDKDISLATTNAALVNISNYMSPHSRMDMSLNSTTPRLLTAFGITAGILTIIKFDKFRISCFLSDLSEASVAGQLGFANAYVYNGTPSLWTYTNSTGVLKFDGDAVANTSIPVGLLNQASKIQVWATDGTNIIKVDFTREDIAVQIAINRPYMVRFSASDSFTITWESNANLVVSNSAGTARVRRVYRY